MTTPSPTERELFHAFMESNWPGIDTSMRADGTYSKGQSREDDWEVCKGARAELTGAQSAREHITDGKECWCHPEVNYLDPDTGIAVIVHREPN